jgi:hypothetical protein
MDLQQYLADISLNFMSQLHGAIVHLTGGQVLGSAFGMPVAVLHTVERKSGPPGVAAGEGGAVAPGGG